jgi:putative glycosyltransferase (TIGR04348 family)
MPSSTKPVVRIVTPGTRAANNGNWRTAVRWAAMLRGSCRVILQTAWAGEPADVLVALHARRSAGAVRGFRERFADRPIVLVMTGTDLYRDLPNGDPAVPESLRIADRIVVLQDDALRHLPSQYRDKAAVIVQSARALRPAAKARDRLGVVVVGHLREEKDPATLFRALEALPHTVPIRVLHIGAPLDARLARQAESLARRDARYRWAGALPHGLTRAAIKRAHVLVHPSRLEGGANVIAEAIVSGTAVIGSRMSGNIGMLGASYPALFPVGDALALAALLERAATEPAFRSALRRACDARKSLFRPGTEAAAVRALVLGLHG